MSFQSTTRQRVPSGRITCQFFIELRKMNHSIIQSPATASRKGWTLVEMVFIFSAETVIIGLCAGLLLLVFETKAKEERGDGARLAAPRLAEQFRDDVRDAGDVKLEGNTLTLTFLDNTEVQYTIDINDSPEATAQGKYELIREERRENEKPRKEFYALPKYSAAWFEPGKDRHAGLMALHIWTKPVDRVGTEIDTVPPKERLNGFTREISAKTKIDPKFAGNWRVIVGKCNTIRNGNPEKFP